MESRIQFPLTKAGIRNPWFGIQNPRLSWIPCTWGERGKVVLGLGYQVSTGCDNMYLKYVRHVLRSPSCELHRKTSSFDEFTFFRVDEETGNQWIWKNRKNRKRHRTLNSKICLYFSLPRTENRVLKKENRKPQGTKKANNRSVQKPKNWLQKKWLKP